MFSFSKRSRLRLQGVHPDLILVVSRGLLYSEVDFAVTEGVRTLDRQRMLLSTGKSWTLRSNHLRQDDGFSHAVDVMAVGDLDENGYVDAQDKSIAWDPELYGKIAVGMSRAANELAIGIRWGGTFKAAKDGSPRFDGPHFELNGG